MRMCEVCGENPAKAKVKINSTILSVCESCAQFGVLIEMPKVQTQSSQPSFKIVEHLENQQESLVPNYAQLIKQARSAAGLNQEEFAAKLSIPLNVLKLAEAGKRLEIPFAKKIEKVLKIKLVES
ncbi:MAG: helix-turn-helix domain-containing protein [Candidatus Nanoarchaeia archaeon]